MASFSSLTLILRSLLCGVIIYSALVCPTDCGLKHNICRGLYIYRETVLRPFLYRPFDNVWLLHNDTHLSDIVHFSAVEKSP
jgi:hypothetical protein